MTTFKWMWTLKKWFCKREKENLLVFQRYMIMYTDRSFMKILMIFIMILMLMMMKQVSISLKIIHYMTAILLNLMPKRKMLFQILLEVHCQDVTEETENITVPQC